MNFICQIFTRSRSIDRRRQGKIRAIRLNEIVLVIGKVHGDPVGQGSPGKVLFNGIVRPSTMLIPLGTRSLLGRFGH